MRSCAAVSVTARSSSAKLRRSPLTEYDRRRESDVSSATAAALPHAEADQLQPFERAVAEVELGIREFSGRLLLLVRE